MISDRQFYPKSRNRALYQINSVEDLVNAKTSISTAKLNQTARRSRLDSETGDILPQASLKNTGLPDHLQSFKEGWERHLDRIETPVFHQLSPRSKRKLSQLPNPSENELLILEAIEEKITKINGADIYQTISKISDNKRIKSYRPHTRDQSSSPSDSVGTASMVENLSKTWNPAGQMPPVDLNRSSTAFFDRRKRIVEVEQRRKRLQDQSEVFRVSTASNNLNGLTPSLPNLPTLPLSNVNPLPTSPKSELNSFSFTPMDITATDPLSKTLPVPLTPLILQSELTQYLEMKRPGSVQDILHPKAIKDFYKTSPATSLQARVMSQGNRKRKLLSTAPITSLYSTQRKIVPLDREDDVGHVYNSAANNPNNNYLTDFKGIDGFEDTSDGGCESGSGGLPLRAGTTSKEPFHQETSANHLLKTSSYRQSSFTSTDKEFSDVESKQQGELSLTSSSSPGPGPEEASTRAIQSPSLVAIEQRNSDSTGSTKDTLLGEEGDVEKLVDFYRPVILESLHATSVQSQILNHETAFHSTTQKISRQFVNFQRWKGDLYDHDHIDIDPHFNSMRKYGSAISNLFYYRIRIILLEAFNHLRRHTVYQNTLRRQEATLLLQRVGRGFLNRVHVAHIRKNIELQQQAAERIRHQRFSKLTHAAWIIIRNWRRRVLRRRVEVRATQKRSAITIQSIFRGRFCRRVLLKRAAEARRRRAAAVKIQCLFRRRLAYRQVQLLRKLHAVRIWEHGIARKLEDYRRDFLREGAALCIAGAYRSYVLRDRLTNLLYWNKFMVAIDFQRVFRGHRARKRVRHLLKEKRDLRLKRNHSAIRIQCFFRMIAAVRKLDKLVEEREQKKAEKLQLKREMLKKFDDDPIVQRKREIFKILRWYTPFRYLIGMRAATKIQSVYRGHRGRLIVHKRRIRMLLGPIFEHKYKLWKAARSIQRLWRGHVVRKLMTAEMKNRNAFRIQCWWRFHHARKHVNAVRLKMMATNVVMRWAKNQLVKQRYKKKIKIELARNKYVRVIQRACKRYLAKNLRNQIKNERRAELESRATANLAFLKALSAIQLTLIAESLERSIGRRYKTRSGSDCFCLGTAPAIFVNALGKKGLTEPASLASNRIDGSNFLKLVMKIPGLFLEAKTSFRNPVSAAPRTPSSPTRASTSSSPSPPPSPSKGSVGSGGGGGVSLLSGDVDTLSVTTGLGSAVSMSGKYHTQNSITASSYQLKNSFALLEAWKLGLIQVPKIMKKISKTDFDLYFNKSKTTPGVNILTFAEFVMCIRYIANFAFDSFYPPKSTEFSLSRSPSRRLGLQRSLSGRDRSMSGRMSPVSDGDTSEDGNEWSAEEDDEMLNVDVEERGKTSNNILQRGISMLTRTKSGRRFKSLANDNRNKTPSMLSIVRKKYHSKRYRIFFPTECLESLEDTAGLSLVIYILRAVRKEDWMAEIGKFLELESKAIAGHYASRIQRMVRRRFAKEFRAYLFKRNKAEKLEHLLYESALRIQRTVRIYLSRMRVIHQAQRVIKKYVPQTGPPYWFNPTMDTTTWHKPKILGSYDCLSIPVPAAGLEYVVYCTNCPRQARINCLSCEDSFCDVCFSSLHCKGSRKFHKSHPISSCSMCSLQMATKSCITCALRKPKRGSPQEQIGKDFSTLCDTCFCHVHDHSESKPELNWEKRDATRALETSQDAYIVGQFIHAKLITNHKYSNLVQPCEECMWRAAAWRCDDCDQVYCDRCLIGLHSIGGPFSRHNAETLPYYSPAMHLRFEQGALTRRVSARVDRVAQEFSRVQLQIKVQSIIKVQSWWRMIRGARVGRAYMKDARKEIRHNYRFRKRETEKHRNTWSYKIRDVFGYAPILKSDTREEQVLKKISYLGRLRAREYISKNKEDWGFYKVSRTIPRKGVPKTGFDVGEIAELEEQARKGGFRLPGKCLLKIGEMTHPTTSDLSNILIPGEFVRIQNYVLGVSTVTASTISFDRRWRGKDNVEEIIYRLPSLRDEKKRRYWKMRHMMYDILVRNAMTQNILKGHMNLCLRIASMALGMVRQYKLRGFMQTAKRWTEFSNRYKQYAQMSAVLLDENNVSIKLVDLSEVGTEDIKKAIDAGQNLADVASMVHAEQHGNIVIPTDEQLAFTSDKRRMRIQKEMNMTTANLLKEADKWSQEFDVFSQKMRFVHKDTGERTYDIPKSVAAHNAKIAEEEKMKLQFIEMKSKMKQLNEKYHSTRR